MSNLIITISKNDDGVLTMNNPAGKNAIELGYLGTIQLNIGPGFTGTGQFDLLTVAQGTTKFTLDLLAEGVQPITSSYPNGAVMYLYNDLRKHFFIRNDGQDPLSGEEDLEFSLAITDSAGTYSMDPEIRVKSGTAAGTAEWASHSGD